MRLLNFRDAWPTDADGSGGDGGVGCTRALAAVRAAAATCNGTGDGDSADDRPPAKVAALTMSLMDGRGLADLHFFVALPHLARTERDLRAQTDRARDPRVARRQTCGGPTRRRRRLTRRTAGTPKNFKMCFMNSFFSSL